MFNSSAKLLATLYRISHSVPFYVTILYKFYIVKLLLQIMFLLLQLEFELLSSNSISYYASVLNVRQQKKVLSVFLLGWGHVNVNIDYNTSITDCWHEMSAPTISLSLFLMISCSIFVYIFEREHNYFFPVLFYIVSCTI